MDKKDLNNKIQIVEWSEMSKESKILLLKAFNIEEDSEGFVTKNGKRVIDKYIKIPIKFDNIALLPSKSDEPIIIDDNPLSIASYLEELENKSNKK